MKRAIVLLGCVSVLSLAGCLTRHAEPTPQPIIVFSLALDSPPGAGKIVLTRTVLFNRSPGILPDSISYSAGGEISTTDDVGEWSFRCTPLNLSFYPLGIINGLQAVAFRLRNTGSETLSIDWSRSTILDRQGIVHPVLHRGVSLQRRSEMTGPSVLPAGAILDEFVFPSDEISFDHGWKAFPFIEGMGPGSSFTVIISITGRADRRFTFTARH